MIDLPAGRRTITVELFPDEEVSSAMLRQASLFQMRSWGYYGREVLRATHSRPVEVARCAWAAAVLGISEPELLRHTLRAHVPDRSRVPRIGTRPTTGAGCLRCGYTSFWAALILVNTCTRCGDLLGPRADIDPASLSAAQQMQATYLEDLQRGGGPSDRVRRLFRALDLWRAVSEPDKPRHTRLGAAWKSPDKLARFAGWAWDCTASDSAFVALVDGWRALILGSTLREEELGPELTQRHRLHEAIRSRGIAERHIPHFVLTDTNPLDVTPSIEDVGLGAARALVDEIHLARTGTPMLAGRIDALLGATNSRPMARTHATLFQSTPDGLIELRRQLEAIEEPGVDYEHRRATLRTLRAIPTTTMREADLPRDQATRMLAAGWLWTQITNGTLRTSGASTKAVRNRLASFDASLFPDQKLALIEYGHQVLRAVTCDVSIAAKQSPGTIRVVRNAG